jgi:hypothetical protein
MQALVLLSQFSFSDIMNMLQQSPLTPAITEYLKGIKTKNPRKELDKIAYDKLCYKKRTQLRNRQLTLLFTKLRSQHGISPPQPGTGKKISIRSLWTMQHSREYLEKVALFVPNAIRMSAIELRDCVLYHSKHGHLSENPSPLAILPPVDQQLTLTHVNSDVHEIETVLGHKRCTNRKTKRSYYEYKVKWVGHEKLSWVHENRFVGLTLCEYWKEKYDNEKGIKLGAENKKIKFIQADSDDVSGDDSYIITSILDAERYGDTIFYQVLWAGDAGTTWEPELHFDNDIILRDYWRNIYLDSHLDSQ